MNKIEKLWMPVALKSDERAKINELVDAMNEMRKELDYQHQTLLMVAPEKTPKECDYTKEKHWYPLGAKECVWCQDKPSTPTLAERLCKKWETSADGRIYKEVLKEMADESKKAFEELVENMPVQADGTNRYLISQPDLIERIKAL